MKKKRKKILDKKISNNVIAVFLIIAIIIAAIGTYMVMYNSYTPRIIKGEPMATVGEVGIYVNNPDIPKEGGVNEAG